MGVTSDQFSLALPSSLFLAPSSASQSRTKSVFDASATAPLAQSKSATTTWVTLTVTVMGTLSTVPSLAVTVTV